MKNIFNSRQITETGVNQSFGNHLLHLFYIYNLSKKRGLKLNINCNSNLDNLLDLSSYKTNYIPSTCFFEERYGGQVDEYIEKDKYNLENLERFLTDSSVDFPDNFYMNGWFWYYNTSPDISIFNDIKIKPELIEYVKIKYPHILRDDCVTLHYRGTDFKSHTIGWGDIRLPIQYYKDSIDDIVKDRKIKKITVVSDDSQFILQNLKEYNIEIIPSNENYFIDWLIIFLSKNLISSNSSFCWTAGLFNKDLIIQPKGFFLYSIDNNKIYPTNVYYKKSKII